VLLVPEQVWGGAAMGKRRRAGPAGLALLSSFVVGSLGVWADEARPDPVVNLIWFIRPPVFESEYVHELLTYGNISYRDHYFFKKDTQR
jgi:hypothetical protein